MCGLAGVMRRDGPVATDPWALAAHFGAALAHRGPDGTGAWLSADRDVLLVHRRLAIIDPGPDGDQPMAADNDRHHIVYNGEIYNYRELRGDLESRGERFATRSDTEVLLRLLIKDGPAALARVRGMFAVAWFDAGERSLLVARDRFGMKPLYVTASSRHIGFASELGALRRARLVDGEPSAPGILSFLRWGSVPPPLTWLRGAEMLAPGTWMEWRQDGRSARGVFADTRDAYRSDRRRPAPAQTFRSAVGEAVRDSVRAHLVADVPVGLFLSGGIDSSAILSAAASVQATDLQTFTIGVDDRSSEAGRARRVAAIFGAKHHELQVDVTHVASELPGILARIDQPTIDGVNTFYVARAVAQTGIKAVLTGTGGDEMFGGYPSFARLPRAIAVKRALGSAWPLLAPLAGAALPLRLKARWQHFAETNGRLLDAYRVQRGFLMPREIDSIAGPALRDRAAWREATEGVDLVERTLAAEEAGERPRASVARLETRLYLLSQLLRDTDVMAMAHGIEVRLPFVDHELLETVWPELGFHDSLLPRKRLLHQTLERPLPDEVVRHPKQGFTLPFARWIGGALAPAVRDGMRRLGDSGWIDAAAPDRVWDAWKSGAVHWSRPWGLAVLGHCLSSGRP
jgi:asparagine synthase (glutamine-hydrolysing)